MAAWNSGRRPYKSLSLPHNGVDAVDVSSVALTTQAS